MMNYYEILEVSPNASPEVIRAAYRSLIQRYHPDKHPDNAAAAARTSQIIQAYQVLADAGTRAIYDLELKQPLPYPRRAISDVDHKPFHALAWGGICFLILAGAYLLLPSSPPLSPEDELKAIRASLDGNTLTPKEMTAKIHRLNAILSAHPDIQQKEARDKAKEIARRTRPQFILNLTVHLMLPAAETPSTAPKPPEPVLTIPTLGVRVGTFDAEKFIQHIEDNQEFISQKLAEKLSYADYEKLGKPHAELYLKKMILDALNEITHTNPNEDYPASQAEIPGRYGVIAVLLPDAFSIRQERAE
jgi:hypothetical protein